MTATGPTENLVLNTIKQIRRTRWDGKIDHNFSSTHRIFGRYSQARHRAWKGDYQAQFAWREIDPNAQPAPVDHFNGVFSDMLILSPTTNNEFRFGFNRRARHRSRPSLPARTGRSSSASRTSPRPPSRFSTSATAWPGLPSFQNIGEDFTFEDNLTKLRGKHTFKAGYQLIRTRYNATAGALPSGTYNFGGTNVPFVPNTGNTFASFLLGTVTSATFTDEFASWLPRWWSHQWYVQDDWKPMRGLTLSLGVRWSYESPFETKYGQQSQFDPAARDPISGRMGAIVHHGRPARQEGPEQLRAARRPRLELPSEDSSSAASFGLVHQDIFSTGTNIMFQEYLATANLQAPVGDPQHVFRLSQGPELLHVHSASRTAPCPSSARITPAARPAGGIRTCACRT